MDKKLEKIQPQNGVIFEMSATKSNVYFTMDVVEML